MEVSQFNVMEFKIYPEVSSAFWGSIFEIKTRN